MLEGVRLVSESKQTVNYDWRVKPASAVLHMYVSYNDDDDDGIHLIMWMQCVTLLLPRQHAFL